MYVSLYIHKCPYIYIYIYTCPKAQNQKTKAHETQTRYCIGCEYKHRLFSVAVLCSNPPEMFGTIPDISIVVRTCLCVSRKAVLWSKHFNSVIEIQSLGL